MPLVYIAVGYASSDIDLVYTTVGYTNNAVDVGCTTIGNKGFTALIGGWLGMPLVYIHSCWVC